MEVCKNCGTKLITKATKKTAEQLKKPYYYKAYYFCPHCKKLYHDEKFKVYNTQFNPELAEGLPSSLFGNAKTSNYDVEIWTDGACVNNGKPNAKAAWGFVAGKKEAAGLVDGLQTNNRAEAYAIYYALVWAAEKKFHKIKLHTDSQISIHGANKHPSKVVKNRDIFEQIAKVITAGHLEVTYIKVLGHSGEINNERVDKLANDLARSL